MPSIKPKKPSSKKPMPKPPKNPNDPIFGGKPKPATKKGKGPNVVRKVATRVVARNVPAGPHEGGKVLKKSISHSRANIAKIAAKKGRALTKAEKQGVTQRSTRRTAKRLGLIKPKNKK